MNDCKWSRKNLVSIESLSLEEIDIIFNKASKYKEGFGNERDTKVSSLLKGKIIVNLFLEPSTRTQVAFEIAAKRLGAEVISINADSSSITKGESLKDTAQNLESLSANMIIMRHRHAGSAEFLTRVVDIPVINAGDGYHEHPSQALLDCFTLKEHYGNLSGKKITIVGDILFSRVARSNIFLLNKLGAEVTLTGPKQLLPKMFEKLGAKVCYDFKESVKDADAVIMLRIQHERQTAKLIPSLTHYTGSFGLNKSNIHLLKPNTLIMHPGPINRDIELDCTIADSPNSVIRQQVTNGVAIRMAIIDLCFNGL